ncbi:MAG: Adenine phosphoribosyltransferase [Elusimicrobia bacterium ADurb.Bin231]|nr:MAG: Adenine phosphoribosyltransferase [Elusimicrobia bacterium ADurb.Bin231]
MELERYIRDIPDFPKKGIMFKDITPLLKDARAFETAIEMLAAKYKDAKIDKIASMESRGFILGAALSMKLRCGFIPIRKKGKLPYETIREEYALEYGTDLLEMHKDALEKGENILIVDDVLATGGTANAVCRLIEKLGGNIAALCFLIELSSLNPRKKLEGYPIESLIIY